MGFSNKRIKIGDAAGLSGAKLIVSPEARDFDVESMVVTPDEHKAFREPEPTQKAPAMALFMAHGDRELNIVGFLKEMEFQQNSIKVHFQALLSVFVRVAGVHTAEEIILQRMLTALPGEEDTIWEFGDWVLTELSSKDISGNQAIVAFSFAKKVSGE